MSLSHICAALVRLDQVRLGNVRSDLVCLGYDWLCYLRLGVLFSVIKVPAS